MTKGMRITLITHVVGSIFALILAWYLPPLFPPIFDTPHLEQALLLTLAVIWCTQHFFKILRRKDPSAERMIQYFDNRR